MWEDLGLDKAGMGGKRRGGRAASGEDRGRRMGCGVWEERHDEGRGSHPREPLQGPGRRR